jgi:hypothetical protein
MRNSAPAPSQGSIDSSPPILRIARREIVNPRPIPCCSLVSDLSCCQKGSNIFSCRLSGMPGPASFTRILRCRVSLVTIMQTSLPSGENLAALENRCLSVLSNRTGSHFQKSRFPVRSCGLKPYADPCRVGFSAAPLPKFELVPEKIQLPSLSYV